MTRNEAAGHTHPRRRQGLEPLRRALVALGVTMNLWGCLAQFAKPPEPDADAQPDASVQPDTSVQPDADAQFDGGAVCGNDTVEAGEECDTASTPDATDWEPCSCGGGTRERLCSLTTCQWEAFSECSPPECSGRGDCADGGTCNCPAEYAGLLCESCNEPDNYFFNGSDCVLAPATGTCEASENPFDSDPIRGCGGRLAEFPHGYICEAANVSCGGCGGGGRSIARVIPCIWDAQCLPENCYCACDCPGPDGSVLRRRCPGGAEQVSTCDHDCHYALNQRPNCWSPWSPDC